MLAGAHAAQEGAEEDEEEDEDEEEGEGWLGGKLLGGMFALLGVGLVGCGVLAVQEGVSINTHCAEFYADGWCDGTCAAASTAQAKFCDGDAMLSVSIIAPLTRVGIELLLRHRAKRWRKPMTGPMTLWGCLSGPRCVTALTRRLWPSKAWPSIISAAMEMQRQRASCSGAQRPQNAARLLRRPRLQKPHACAGAE